MMRILATAAIATMAGSGLAAQNPLPVDSALIKRILIAEDRRDSTDSALANGIASADPRVSTLARRALGRIRDQRFAARDSFPVPVPPPVYAEPAWLARFRALASRRDDCPALRAALSDSVWHIRLRAADLLTAKCAGDAEVVATLRQWIGTIRPTRSRGGAAWQPGAHAIVALARLAPATARDVLPTLRRNDLPWVRVYVARAAEVLSDTATLRTLARDSNDNVREEAIGGLSRLIAHAGDDSYLAALSAPGYQAVRAAAVALKGSPRTDDVRAAILTTAARLRRDSSETSRDARLEVMARLGEVARDEDRGAISALTADFDCAVVQAGRAIVEGSRTATGSCSALSTAVPAEAVALALGADVRLRVTIAAGSGGGTFTVRLRGDAAPIMSARILELARSHYYDGLTWHRVVPDFVVQGGSRGDNEYVGHPRFLRDELGTIPHVRGTVGMSTRGHDTGDSQWFVNLKDNIRLGRDYTVFAEVIDGIDVVDGILEGDRIERIEVVKQ